MASEPMTFRDSPADVESRVKDLLQQMSLAEKIGQMTQVEKNSITPEAVKEFAIGSILSGGGGNPKPNSGSNWVKMVTDYAEAALQTRLEVPLIYGVDAVHGHNNVKDAVIFPHNIGLGATRDADVVRRIGQATARACLATGVHWDFAPAVSVPQDIRWGRTYEGYSQDTDLVTELALAYIEGLHAPDMDGMWVLPSVKHFVGDGGAVWGTTKPISWLVGDNWQAPSDDHKIDQGDTQVDEETLRTLHLAPYVKAIEAGALNVMASFSSWNGLKMHAHKYLLTDVLKGELGFEGFVVSDWQAIDQLHSDFYQCVVISINAGLDMIMVPFDYKKFIETLEEAVNKGDIPMERINDAVSRILSVKIKLGLFEKPLPEAAWLATLGSEEHRAIAREAVQKSLVLLKNENNALPLDRTKQIFVAGHADNIGFACGGWSIEWQGGSGAITAGATLLDGLKRLNADVVYSEDATFDGHAPVGVVVIAEEPYAEGLGDRSDISLSEEQTQLIQKARQHCDQLVLVIYSGRPLVIGDALEHCDAVVAGWLPGSESHAIADVLVGDVAFTGKLAFDWPRSMDQIPLAALKESAEGPLWAFGHGLSV